MFLKKSLIFLIASVLSPILLFAQPLVLDGTGDIVGENIQHPSGNVFDQILLTGETIRLQAKPNQITRVSFMDETEDIVQVEFSGAGSFTVTLDPATFLPAAIPPATIKTWSTSQANRAWSSMEQTPVPSSVSSP